MYKAFNWDRPYELTAKRSRTVPGQDLSNLLFCAYDNIPG